MDVKSGSIHELGALDAIAELLGADDEPSQLRAGSIVRHASGRHVARWGPGTGRAGFVIGAGVIAGTVLVSWAGAPPGTVRVEREALLEELPVDVRDEDRWRVACRRARFGGRAWGIR